MKKEKEGFLKVLEQPVEKPRSKEDLKRMWDNRMQFKKYAGSDQAKADLEEEMKSRTGGFVKVTLLDLSEKNQHSSEELKRMWETRKKFEEKMKKRNEDAK